MIIRLLHSFLGIVMIGLLFPFSIVAFVAPEQVTVQPGFPGKYVAFGSRILGP